MNLNTNHSMTIDPAFAPCRCGLAKNEHPESRWYADADDDPAAELLQALKELIEHYGSSQVPTSHTENMWTRARAVARNAEAAIANARVLSCRKGYDAIQAALQPEMQFEEARRDE